LRHQNSQQDGDHRADAEPDWDRDIIVHRINLAQIGYEWLTKAFWACEKNHD
jgi:hypothetical protein